MNEAILGTCTEMCSDEEIKFRESQKLLHVLEMVRGTETRSIPKADRNKIIKIYTRSAAGLNVALPKNLRTVKTLLQTVDYLLHDVISMTTLPWHVIYDFVANRLLAVRQDMLIQRISKWQYISLLQPIIRFYAYSAYRLCELPIVQFDPVLNNKQLQECLKKLLKFYDDCQYISLREDVHVNLKEYECIYADSRPFFEALYIIFNMGDFSAICRGLSLQKKWRTEIVNMSLQISMSVQNGNWYRACKLIKKLPTLLAAVASLHLLNIRRETFRRMSVAYSSKNLTYPLNALKTQLLYNNKTELLDDCTFYNIKVQGDTLRFTKEIIFPKELVKVRQEKFVDEKLSTESISTLILDGYVY